MFIFNQNIKDVKYNSAFKNILSLQMFMKLWTAFHKKLQTLVTLKNAHPERKSNVVLFRYRKFTKLLMQILNIFSWLSLFFISYFNTFQNSVNYVKNYSNLDEYYFYQMNSFSIKCLEICSFFNLCSNKIISKFWLFKRK